VLILPLAISFSSCAHHHHHQVGVKEVVLAINYKPELMANYLKKYESEVRRAADQAARLCALSLTSLVLSRARSRSLQLGIKISYSQETQPLGTGTQTLRTQCCARCVSHTTCA
jgi:NDP-sugar pyrophosphorylase family protein